MLNRKWVAQTVPPQESYWADLAHTHKPTGESSVPLKEGLCPSGLGQTKHISHIAKHKTTEHSFVSSGHTVLGNDVIIYGKN